MPVISDQFDGVVLINIFSCEPENQQRLLHVLQTATEQEMKHHPGFISASLHRSADGRKVANYAQWESAEAWRAMLASPRAGEHMREAEALGTPDYNLYHVRFVADGPTD